MVNHAKTPPISGVYDGHVCCRHRLLRLDGDRANSRICRTPRDGHHRDRAPHTQRQHRRGRGRASDDIPDILACLQAGFANVRDAYSPAAFAATVLDEHSLRARMAAMQVIVAVRPSGRVIGTIAYGVASPNIGRIRGMAVLPRDQGTGIAAALLESGDAGMCQTGCVEARLGTTTVLSRAIAFYERHGFVHSSRLYSGLWYRQKRGRQVARRAYRLLQELLQTGFR